MNKLQLVCIQYKFLLITFLLFSSIHILSAKPTINLKLTTEYDSNVFNFTDSEKNRFEDGLAFSYIESSDDLIQKLDFRISDTFNYQNVFFSPYIKSVYTAYLNNNDKNSWTLLTGINSRVNKFRFNGTYGYYPNNYLRKYRDTDGTNKYEKFEYEKMSWRFTASYLHSNYIRPVLYFKYEYYHYNQYFTEYDGAAITPGFGWRFIFDLANVELFYYYRTYNPESDHKDIQYIIDNVKDASYDSNIYELKIRSKRYYSTLLDYRFYTGFRYEDRYFQSQIPIAINPFHASRNDRISTFNIGSDMWLAKNLNFNLDLKYRFRNVNSNYEPVVNLKEYQKYQISTTIEWAFDLIN